MGAISDIRNPWREILLGMPASFRGVIFHVEQGSRSSGRRTVTHEYPKRNTPYAEDMGRHARRWAFTGYLIYRPTGSYDYVDQRDALREALEDDDAGQLVHPVFAPDGIKAVCERYSMSETRDRGGYTQFEMSFVEAGSPGNSQVEENTAQTVKNNADATKQSVATSTNGLSVQ